MVGLLAVGRRETQPTPYLDRNIGVDGGERTGFRVSWA